MNRPPTNIQNFDIGIAGPVAGFVVAIAALFYAFQTLPPPEYIFQFHPEYVGALNEQGIAADEALFILATPFVVAKGG